MTNIFYDQRKFDQAIQNAMEPRRLALMFGDSWLHYMNMALPTDISVEVAKAFQKTLFLNEAVPGQDSISWKRALPDVEREIAGYKFDAILLSNGGNDIVGSEMRDFLKKAGQTQAAGNTAWGPIPKEVYEHVRLETFEAALRYAIVDLKQVVDFATGCSPSTLIFVHTYDYVWPTGKGYTLGPITVGPWMKPYLDEVELTDPVGQRVLTSWLVDQFARELKTFASQNAATVRVVDSRGVLQNVTDWDNEIHPTPAGFGEIAKKCWVPALAAVLR